MMIAERAAITGYWLISWSELQYVSSVNSEMMAMRLRKQSQHQDRSERYLQHRYRDAEKARPCAQHIVREDGEVLRHTRIGLRAVGDEQNVRASEMGVVLEDSLVQPQHAQHHPCRAKGDRRGTSDPSCVSSHINAAAPKASLALSQLIMTVSYIDASVSLSVNV